MNESAESRGSEVPPPARPDGDEAPEETGRDAGTETRSSRSDRPTSVRETMPADRRYPARRRRRPVARQRRPAAKGIAPPPARELADTREAEAASRQVEVGGEVWTVLVKGSARAGSGRARGAPLLSIGFKAPGGQPDPECTRYLVAARLEDVAEDVLCELVTEVKRGPEAKSGSELRGRKGPSRGRHRRRIR